MEQFSQKAPLNTVTPPSLVHDMGAGGGITIGEALEATVLTAGKKPVEWSDAAAIQAAEVRATGRTNIIPGGVAAAAQSAATLNARATKDEEKTKLADILAVLQINPISTISFHHIRALIGVCPCAYCCTQKYLTCLSFRSLVQNSFVQFS